MVRVDGKALTLQSGASAFRGALFTVGMRWTDRLIGLVSTLILARLLVPADFGLVAMAMVVVGLIDVILNLGVSAALVQNQAADASHFNTAWTLRLCQASSAALLIALCAPYAADYYKDPRIIHIMWVMAATLFVGGFENIGIVRFQKDMEFNREFRLFFATRTLSTAFTISAALLLQSYWALVLGSLVGKVIAVVLSYVMQPFRPKLSLANSRQIWSFSQWNMVMNIAQYATTRLDKFVVGRRADASVMGAYSLADEVSSMPTSELLAPLGRVMFPAFVRARNDESEFRRIVLLALSVQAIIGVPAGVGIALVAQEAVPLLLGNQWGVAVPLVQVLGLVGVFTSLLHSSNYMLLALGRIKTLALFYTIQFLALLTLLLVVSPQADARGVALSRLAVAVFAVLVMKVLAGSAMSGFGVGAVLSRAWRPAAAVAVMTVSVLSLSSLIAPDRLVTFLVAKVSVGVVSYVLACMALWRLAGCPAGAESYLLEKLRMRKLPPLS